MFKHAPSTPTCNLVPTLSAAENITLPADLAGTPIDQGWFDELVGRLGIADRLSHRPSELSGGQQQRIACARALICRPEFRDRSLELAFWFPAERCYVDGEGRAVSLSDVDSGRSETFVERDGQPIAVLPHDPVLEHNAELVQSSRSIGACPTTSKGAPTGDRRAPVHHEPRRREAR